MASTASNMTSNDSQPLASKSSILQELCSRPKNYGANPAASLEASNTASEGEKQPMLPVQPILPQPDSPSLKMKIKRSNSTNSKEEDKLEQPPKKSSNSKKRKDVATSSSSTSSSRSSSPRYYMLFVAILFRPRYR